MKPQLIIIAILIILKGIGVASRANAYTPCFNNDRDYGFGYDSDGLNEHGQKSIEKIAQESACNKHMESLIEVSKFSPVYNLCNNELEFKLINNYRNPIYRCGDLPLFKRI